MMEVQVLALRPHLLAYAFPFLLHPQKLDFSQHPLLSYPLALLLQMSSFRTVLGTRDQRHFFQCCQAPQRLLRYSDFFYMVACVESCLDVPVPVDKKLLQFGPLSRVLQCLQLFEVRVVHTFDELTSWHAAE